MGKEIKMKSNEVIFTKTDLSGRILFGNDVFEKMSGLKKEQYIGKPHSIIRHQDMPKAIFKIMWDAIQKGEDLIAIIKNTTVDGNYYWVATHFEVERDDNGKPIAYEAIRIPVSNKAKKEMEVFYKELRSIERMKGVEASEKYIQDFLFIKNITFNDYMYALINDKSILEKTLKI